MLATLDLTPFEFIDRPRNYSPIVSELRLNPKNGIGIEWRADYDPLRDKIVNSSFSAEFHFPKYLLLTSATTTSPVTIRIMRPTSPTRTCSPRPTRFAARSVSEMATVADGMAVTRCRMTFARAVTQYMAAQATYNTDCCGFSFQWRRFTFGTLNDNQYRVAFTIANVGSFGTLKKQERLF